MPDNHHYIKRMSPILIFLRKKHLYLGAARYTLGIVMLPYAITKILKTQFVLSGHAWAQAQSFETVPGTMLTWAFLGHAPWFQVLLGFLELIPALLLFFRRTTLLGAILMLPLTINVLLINYALELWEGTKIISGILFFLNLIVLAFHHGEIRYLIMKIIGRSSRIRYANVETSYLFPHP